MNKHDDEWITILEQKLRNLIEENKTTLMRIGQLERKLEQRFEKKNAFENPKKQG